MLGEEILEPEGSDLEIEAGAGLGLLPVRTTMTEALGGNATALERFKIRNGATDLADYPQ